MGNQESLVVQPSTLDNMLKYIELTGIMNKRALDDHAAHSAAKKKAAELKGTVVEHIKAAGFNTPPQLESMLDSHQGTMQLLMALTKRAGELRKDLQKNASQLGSAADPSEVAGRGVSGGPGYDSVQDTYIGRVTMEKKASDMALLKVYES